MYTQGDMSYPVLRLIDAYVVPTQAFFTYDDGHSSLPHDLLGEILVDRLGVVWRTVEVRRVALPKKGFFARNRYARQYQLERQGGMSLEEVKAKIVPIVEAQTAPWSQVMRANAILAKIENARDMTEICEAAVKLG